MGARQCDARLGRVSDAAEVARPLRLKALLRLGDDGDAGNRAQCGDRHNHCLASETGWYSTVNREPERIEQRSDEADENAHRQSPPPLRKLGVTAALLDRRAEETAAY